MALNFLWEKSFNSIYGGKELFAVSISLTVKVVGENTLRWKGKWAKWKMNSNVYKQSGGQGVIEVKGRKKYVKERNIFNNIFVTM